MLTKLYNIWQKCSRETLQHIYAMLLTTSV